MSSLNKKFKKTLIIFDDDDNNMDCDEIHQEDSHGNYKNDNYNDDQEKDSDALDDCGMRDSDAPDGCGTGGSIGFPKLPDDDQSESEKLFMKKYEMLGKVGQGTYGKVYRGRERSTGKYVAIKIARIDNPREEGISSCTLREISNLKILNCRDEHIVKLLAVECVEKKHSVGGWVVYLVFEYMDCDLLQVYRDHRYLKESMSPITIKSYMYQLLKGLEHSHNNGILHRDLKPSNLLVNESTGLLKIADWGLGRVVFGRKSTFSNIHGTLCYTAPEQLLGDPLHTFAIDVWAVGCIFAN